MTLKLIPLNAHFYLSNIAHGCIMRRDPSINLEKIRQDDHLRRITYRMSRRLSSIIFHVDYSVLKTRGDVENLFETCIDHVQGKRTIPKVESKPQKSSKSLTRRCYERSQPAKIALKDRKIKYHIGSWFPSLTHSGLLVPKSYTVVGVDEIRATFFDSKTYRHVEVSWRTGHYEIL